MVIMAEKQIANKKINIKFRENKLVGEEFSAVQIKKSKLWLLI